MNAHIIWPKIVGDWTEENQEQTRRYTGRINPLKRELNPSAQRCLPRFLLGILIF
jgi:hypothetical protein